MIAGSGDITKMPGYCLTHFGYAEMSWLRCNGRTSARMARLVDAVMERAVPERVA